MMKKSFGAAIFAAGLLVACNVESGRAKDHAPAIRPPLGLWVWSADEVENLLSISIEMVDGNWRATVDGAAAMTTLDDGVISVTRSDGQKFVGELSNDGSQIRGHWFQPSSPLDYQDVATPIVLPAVANGQWQAEMTLQPRPFRIFLDVFEDKDAEIFAVIRNPEGNNILGASRFRLVADEDDGWTLVAGSGDRERRHDLEQYEEGELLLDYDRFDEPIPLRPATNTLTAGYYSRQDQDRPARPTSPPQLDDGWVVAAPEEVGFDPAALQALTAELASTDPRNRRPRMIHSLLVARGGQLVFEEYFFGHDRETRHDVRSLGKVFGSVMIGALQQQGYSIDAAHRPIPDILQRAGQPLDDPRKTDITLGHLMTFTSGLDCDANSDSIGSESRMWEQQDEKDYWLYTAQLPVLHDPGMRYAYCSGSANLVGASLNAVGGASVYELFDRLIAKPLKFGPYHWVLTPNGEGYLGGGHYMKPRDILKIGAMFADGGVWNGKQVIDEDWVRESTMPQIAISAETTGMTPEVFGNNYFGGSQAYIWRVDTVAVGERRYASYEASGNGGQLLIVVPELDLTVAFTGGNYRMGGIWGRWRNEIVGGHIIPAITDLP
jgi:CubicO group peptidase (beta-lactamase class C family)